MSDKNSGKKEDVVDPHKLERKFRCLRAEQPIGDMFIGTMPHELLCEVAHFDVQRTIQAERDVERYLGIQRPLQNKRVKQLETYVNYIDASFPTSVILAIDSDYVEYDVASCEMTLRNYRDGEAEPSIAIRHMARVLDGQHRIAGLFEYEGDRFDVSVSVFVGMDIADQAYIFSTVNLEQTKVNKSLAYDLFALARSRSPQKTCHNIAVALDRDAKSPFFKRIKRLGIATPNRDTETITQAQFVEALLRYISRDYKTDRDKLLRGDRLERTDQKDLDRLIFREMFIDERDLDITRIVDAFFSAVRERWPTAWESQEEGMVLSRTNGFRALMRVMREIYIREASPGEIVSKKKFVEILKLSSLSDHEFHKRSFPPGSSGESEIYKKLKNELFPDN